ncbi:MAG: hypothetical protein ACN4GT_00990 [Gammaproteobacteria bacterium]
MADWPKAGDGDGLSPAVRANLRRQGLVLDTCLRQLCVAVEPSDCSAHVNLRDATDGLTLHFGIDAYRYLLEVATGLRSNVPGETNVFGQLKKAWDQYRTAADPAAVARIAPWINRLINDAREVRRDHLHGTGGASYGTLIRRLLSPRRGDRVLFVGAGDLTRSILPYFDAFDSAIWNRSIVTDDDMRARRFFAPDHAGEAVAWAEHVILTTPPSDANDARWSALLSGTNVDKVVHLGHRGGAWAKSLTDAIAYDLDDVFELERRQADIRTSRLRRARAACRHAARAVTAETSAPTLFALSRA